MAYHDQSVATLPQTSNNRARKERSGYLKVSLPWIKGGEKQNRKVGDDFALEVGNELHDYIIEGYRAEGDKFLERMKQAMVFAIHDLEAEAGKESVAGF